MSRRRIRGLAGRRWCWPRANEENDGNGGSPCGCVSDSGSHVTRLDPGTTGDIDALMLSWPWLLSGSGLDDIGSAPCVCRNIVPGAVEDRLMTGWLRSDRDCSIVPLSVVSQCQFAIVETVFSQCPS